MWLNKKVIVRNLNKTKNPYMLELVSVTKGFGSSSVQSVCVFMQEMLLPVYKLCERPTL